MAKKERTVLKKLGMGLIGLLAILALLYRIYPSEFIDTFRYFPYHHNPFEWLTSKGITDYQKNALLPTMQKSTLVKFRLPLNDTETREVIVYLPAGYHSTTNEDRYPALYLLHGSPGQDTDWIIEGDAQKTLDTEIADHKINPMIVVFPDGNGGADRDTQFVNSADGKQRNEDFIVKTVVEYVDSNFLTKVGPAWRGIGGFSSGGFGAVNLGLKHQDIFGFSISFSGYSAIEQTPTTDAVIQGSKKVVNENSPMFYIPTLQKNSLRILLMTGSGVNSRIDNDGLATLLRHNGFHVDYTPIEGQHKWSFWALHLADGLEWMNALLDT